MFVLIAAAVIVIYLFVREHLTLITGSLVAFAAALVIVIVSIAWLGRRQVISRPAPRALPPARRMPDPVEPLFSWLPESFAMTGPDQFAQAAPSAPADEISQGNAEVITPAQDEATGTCAWHRCHQPFSGDAWELMIVPLDTPPGVQPEKYLFCSRLCLEFYQNADYARRAAR